MSPEKNKNNTDLDELRSTQGIIRHIDVNNRGNIQSDNSGGTISYSPGAARPFDGTLKRNAKNNNNNSLLMDSGINIVNMNVL